MFTVEIAKYAKVNMSKKIIRGQQKDKTNTSAFKHNSDISKQACFPAGALLFFAAFVASRPPVHLKRTGRARG